MAKYVYKLQSLINVKEKLEEQKKNELAIQNNKLNKEKEILDNYYLEISDILQQQEEKQTLKINAFQMQQYIKYIDKLKLEIEKQVKVVEKEKQIAEKIRLELLEFTKAKKSLEKLKEKDYQNYLEEEKKAEQKIVDEIVSYKYNSREG